MSTDLHIAVLTVGLILVAAAVVVSLLRMAGRQSALTGAGPRLLMGLAGVALILWAELAAHPGAPRALASVTTGAGGATSQSPAASSAQGASPASAGASAPSGAAPSAPAPDVVQPGHPDLIVLAGTEFDGCMPPKQPADPPDGATATRAQMLASHALSQGFDTATNTYLACLDQAERNFDRQYGRGLTVDALREVEAMHTRIHNAAVDVDQTVANKFNQQLRTYKVRGGAT